jgi:Tol biopolymer transport system component
MTPERWQKVKEIFHSALQHEADKRSVFLSNACGSDELLRQEVESLISAHQKGGSFIDSPAFEAAAELIVDEGKLKAGQTLGSYEVLSFVSRGGMGEVYLAQDKRLGRKVALKLLASQFTKDSDRLRRFEQEARAASALNHPNIITIYEIREANSTLMIATEFVEGETLRQRLGGGELDLDEALHVAIQIADALAAAHQAGIVHRDIKPENIMIRPDGYVKVLDFGLAKLVEPASPMSAAEASTKQVKTGSGMIMGTVGYMSPEQARGLTVDARSDVFNLGAVIYEMVARQKPFEGETPSDILAAILKSEPPPLSHFTSEAPPELVRIVTKALRKDREQRYQVVKDMLLDLKSLKEELEFQAKLDRSVAPGKTGEASAAVSQSQTLATGKAPAGTDEIKTAISTITHSLSGEIRRHKVGAILAVTMIVVATIAGVFALYKFLNRSRPAAPANTEAPQILRTEQITFSPGLNNYPALSPDGNSIAYSSDQGDSFEIYVKQIIPGGREIQLTSDGQQNFQAAWSPDGQRIAYYSKNRGGIWLVPAVGGVPTRLTQFGSAPAWSHDGSLIVFQSNPIVDLGAGARNALPPSTIWIVSSQGGTPRQLTQIGSPPGGHGAPSWAPDGKRIVFEVDDFLTSYIWTVSVSGDDLKQVTGRDSKGSADPLWSPDGESIYYVGGSALWRIRVSPKSGEPLGQALTVAGAAPSVIRHPTISVDGKKIAYASLSILSDIWSLPLSASLLGATGSPTQLTVDRSQRHVMPLFSPDGRKIVFGLFRVGPGGDIWMVDADGKNPTQLTTDPATDNVPSWLPEGDRVAFLSDRNNQYMRLWSTTLVGGRDQFLMDLGPSVEFARLSPDGKRVAFNSRESGNINIWVASLEEGVPTQLTFDKELAGFPCWSPDGGFLAFEMKRGDDNYLMTIPSGGGTPTQLTPDHGLSWPHSWAPDGDKITFAGLRNGYWNVYWISRSTKEQKQLTNYRKLNAYVRYPAWSPLGNQIVYEYAETTGNIWSMELK